MTTTLEISNYGSFRDSLKSPIHRWFTYPAGYSYKLVKAKIEANNLSNTSWVADPFLGTGTTSLACRFEGINSLGVEAHPFVYWVASTKMNFEYDLNALFKDIDEVICKATSSTKNTNASWPSLISRCFSEENLQKLNDIKQAILKLDTKESHTNFLKLALTTTLRIVTTAGSGWPYIAPSKFAQKTVNRDAIIEFKKQCTLMISDLSYVFSLGLPFSKHKIIQGDARKISEYTEPESIDLVVTSPPYLNNYDYADRTRLETYFWGIYSNWNEITVNVRDHLMIAATTQIRQSQMNLIKKCPSILKYAPKVHKDLSGIIQELEVKRQEKPGKKTYDYLVAGYFEDMFKVIQQTFTILKSGCQFVLVLGDSAPYGVYIPTEKIIGDLALSAGFSNYNVEILRERGDKWAGNTQRHKVPLKESILTILK